MKIAAIIGFLSWCLVSFGQQKLEFNQIRTITTQEAVPQGKVWKVQTAYLTNDFTYTSAGSTSYAATILINGTTIYTHSWAYRFNGSSSTSTTYTKVSDQSNMQLINFPFWLGAGETLAAGTYVYGLSVIEFNIVP